MESSHPLSELCSDLSFSETSKQAKDSAEEQQRRTYQHFQGLLSTLPSVDGLSVAKLHRHADGWFVPMPTLIATMVFQQLFRARPSDIFLTSYPKSGTTWLKALLFSTVNRHNSFINSDHHPFANLTPHQRIPSLEAQAYTSDAYVDLESLSSPRLFATHVPFQSLPKSIADSHCRIVYISRNPKDNFVSMWHFVNKLRVKHGREPIPIEAAFHMFCNGISSYGPYWDHVLGYWNARNDKQRILFMRYEEWKEDPAAELKRLADFVGCPFTAEEEKAGAVEDIVRLCGFENLKGLEVHKDGVLKTGTGEIDNPTFFRRGVVGDWVNHLTPEMARQIDEIMESRFAGSGLTL